MCRNFDIAALEQRGVAAARVQGISSFEEMLDASIESCTTQARPNSSIKEDRQDDGAHLAESLERRKIQETLTAALSWRAGASLPRQPLSAERR